jgi:hypothetical protein
MKTRKPLQRKVCICCERYYFARSPISKFCSTLCQNRSYRANKKTQEELEVEFNAQELQNNNPLEQRAA